MSREDEDGFLAAQAWDYGDSEEKRRRIMRARACKPSREARANRRRFKRGCATAHQLVLLWKGERSEYVLNSLFSSCPLGWQWAADIEAMMTRGSLTHGIIAEDDIRTLDSPKARELLAWCLRKIGEVQRSECGTKLVITGQDAYWGRQHEVLQEMSDVEFATRKHELEEKRAARAHRDFDRNFSREVAGEVPRRREVQDWEVRRRSLRTYDAEGHHQAKGDAARHKCSVRTIGRRARLARAAGLFRSRQPKAWADDAVMPRIGSWAYGEWCLLREPGEALMAALQECWGEGEAARRALGKPPRRAAGEPRQAAKHSAGAPRGPPSDGSAPDPRDDWGASLGLTASELDDIEQTIGL